MLPHPQHVTPESPVSARTGPASITDAEADSGVTAWRPEMSIYHQFTCEQCGMEFEKHLGGKKARNRFCSKQCYHQWRHNKHFFMCSYCGITFWKANKHAGQKKYFCTAGCDSAWRSRQSIDNISVRFWASIHRGSLEECWNWVASLGTTGYGQITLRLDGGPKKAHKSHRISWFLHNGHIPLGMHVLHKCHNRLCCNPTHPYLGRDKENQADRINDGTSNRGERHGMHKLSEQEVRGIRLKYSLGNASYNRLALEYGVSCGAILCIVRRINWAWLP